GHAPAGIDPYTPGGIALGIDIAGCAIADATLVDGIDAHGVHVFARDQPVEIGGIVVIGDHDIAHRVDGDATPVRTAIIAGELDPVPIGRGRGIDALVIGLAE